MTSAAPGWFRAALEAPVEVGATTVDGASIAYRAWGDAGREGIILVHGGAAHARWWDHIAPLLVEGGRRVVALDLSGHGDSDHREAYGFDVWAREIFAAGEEAGIAGRPVVIGHSMGGAATLWAATLFPSLLTGAIVVDSPLREVTPEEQAAREGRAFGPTRVHPTYEQALARFRPMPEQPVVDYIGAHVAECSLRRVEGGWTWKFDPHIFRSGLLAPSQLSAIDRSLALIRGERGILTRQMCDELSERLGRRVPMTEIPDAGHHIMLDQPLALVSAVRAILAQW